MSSTATRVPDESVGPTAPTLSVTISREQLLLAVIVVSQAVWLGLVMMRGWYSAADLPNIAFANGRSLNWDYLTSTLGGHFGVAQRFVYWLLNRAASARVVAHRADPDRLPGTHHRDALAALPHARRSPALALDRSPRLCVQRLPGPGTAALNSGLGLVIAQACLVGALLAQVRFTRERRLVDAVVVAGLVLVMLAFAQESFPTLVILPILSFVFLQQGPWRDRVRGGLRLWRGWLVLAVAGAIFAGLYLSGDYNSPSSEFTARDGFWLAGQAWLKVLGPALVGGPWHFVSFPNQWSAYAHPPVVMLVLAQVALVGLIVLSVRRTGWLALVAWFIPVWTSAACLVLVGIGRWQFLGELIPSILRYSHYVPVALALGIVLAFGANRLRIADRQLVRSQVVHRASTKGSRAGGGRPAPGVQCLLHDRVRPHLLEEPGEGLHRDPAEERRGARSRRPAVRHAAARGRRPLHLEDVRRRPVGLGGASAEYRGQSPNRLVVDQSGGVVPAKFVEVADFTRPRQKVAASTSTGSAPPASRWRP